MDKLFLIFVFINIHLFVFTQNNEVYPIDESYENCAWTTNYEWAECIKKHSQMWENEQKNLYDSLMTILDEEQQEILKKNQKAWESYLETSKFFLYSSIGSGEIQLQVGREGYIETSIHLMYEIRKHTLELRRYFNYLD